MRKMIWFTTISILFVLFVVPGILASTIKMIPASDQPGYGPRRLSIYGEGELLQKFISREKNLTAIGTTVKNPNLKNKKEVILNLYDGSHIHDSSHNLLRRSVLNGFNIGDGDFVKFVFEVVPDSIDKEYSFTLSSPTAAADETIEVFLMDKPATGIIEYTFADETHEGGIPMVTFHKPNNQWEVIGGVYSNWLSKLLSPRSQKSE